MHNVTASSNSRCADLIREPCLFCSRLPQFVRSTGIDRHRPPLRGINQRAGIKTGVSRVPVAIVDQKPRYKADNNPQRFETGFLAAQ
jgi:hypothetical protein